MTRGQLPNPKSGQSLLAIPAAQWQKLVREVRALRNISTRPPLHAQFNDAGLALWMDEQPSGGGAGGAAVAIKTVIISQAIEDDATDISVLEVAYANSPPQPPTPFTASEDVSFYEIVGDEFKAYPYLGKRAWDYRDLVYAPSGTVTVPTVMDARLIDKDTWMLAAPAAASGTGGVRVARVVSTTPAGLSETNFLLVQPMKTDVTAGGGRFEVADGPQEVVFTWPGLFSGDFSSLVQAAVYVLLVKSGENWVAMQTIPWLMDGAIQSTPVATDPCGP